MSEPKVVKLSDLIPDPKNANQGTEYGASLLERSIRENGAGRSLLLGGDMQVIAGNKTLQAAIDSGFSEVVIVPSDGSRLVAVQRTDIEDSNEAKAVAMAIADNRIGELNLSWNLENLAHASELCDLDHFNFDELPELDISEGGTGDAEAVPDVDDEAEPVSRLGDVWVLGSHRLMCGDSTDPDHVSALMGGELATLIHADPPYGMGKEGDGVANDNLYRERLDKFQMEWWSAFRAKSKDNGSAYIWGTAEDLWRLWYSGGLCNDSDLTFRNEIVWDKGGGMGMGSSCHHQFATVTERALFLMFGQQFLGNQNTADYWEGYEPLRVWLCEQLDRTGWTKKQVNEMTGTHMAGHWFTKSQFHIIARDHYDTLKAHADGVAFVTEYDDLMTQIFPDVRVGGNSHRRGLSEAMRDGRTFFDNVHDIMSDVWSFNRVQGEERHGHATPKPVPMIERCIRSSCPHGEVVAEPFAGSGSTLMACEVSGRRCFTMELLPKWVDVVVRRWQDYSGLDAVLEGGDTFYETERKRAMVQGADA